MLLWCVSVLVQVALAMTHGTEIMSIWALANDLVSEARNGNIEMVKGIILNGVDINQLNDQGDSALLVTKNAQMLCLLLQNGANFNMERKDGTTALHLACYDGDVDRVHQLLQYNVAINKKDAWGRTPLMHLFACRNLSGALDPFKSFGNAARIATMLLDNDANLFEQDELGLMVFHYASMSDKFIDALQLLIDRRKIENMNFVDKDLRTPLFYAAKYATPPVLELLIKNGADPTFVSKLERRPIHFACQGGLLSNVKFLLTMDSLVFRDQGESTLLVTACCHGHVDMAQYLFSQRINPNVALKQGSLIVSFVSRTKKPTPEQLTFIKLLIESASLTIVDKFSILASACRYGSLAMVKLLLKKFQSQELFIKKIYTGRETLLMSACSRTKGVNIVRYLLDLGASPHETDPNTGDTVFHRACSYSSVKVVKMLWESIGLSTRKVVNNAGNTALSLACLHGNIPVIRFLLEQGVDNVFSGNKYGHSAMDIAADGLNFSAIKLLLDYCKEMGHVVKDNLLGFSNFTETVRKFLANEQLDEDQREALEIFFCVNGCKVARHLPMPMKICNLYLKKRVFGQVETECQPKIIRAILHSVDDAYSFAYALLSLFRLFSGILCPFEQAYDGRKGDFLESLLESVQAYVNASRDGRNVRMVGIEPGILYFLQTILFQQKEFNLNTIDEPVPCNRFACHNWNFMSQQIIKVLKFIKVDLSDPQNYMAAKLYAKLHKHFDNNKPPNNLGHQENLDA